MKIVIINYNTPEITSINYKKLLSDGFRKKDIIIADNGSDKLEPPNEVNFCVPKNIRFTGISQMTLNYIIDFFDDENIILTGSSLSFLEDFNYLECYLKAIEKCGGKFGFIAPGLTSGLTKSNAREQEYQANSGLIRIFEYQPAAILLSKRLLEICKKYKAAYFNPHLSRGWGTDRELQFIADLHQIPCYVDRSFCVEWNTNITHTKGLADESVEDYWANAKSEMDNNFQMRYGNDWMTTFRAAFDGHIKVNESGEIIKAP